MSIRIRRKICHQLTLKCWPHPIVCVLMSLLMLSSFVILQMKVESIVILGNVSDELSWLKNVNYLSNFLHPGVKSELLLPRDINSLGQRDEVACFVMSSPGNSLARSAIRRTWGKKMKPIFIMGISDSNTMNSIKNEAELFDDIIVENFFDSYLNLTIKTAFALKHFTRHFSQSKYFFKIDDDVFLNVENLHKFLRHESTPKNSIIGRQGIAVSPHRERESKWYIPRWMFSSEKLPPYIDGPAYLIPGHMVEQLYSTSLKIPFFTLEDVFFTGYVGNLTLKYNLHSNKKFRSKNVPYYHPCLHERFITVHSTSPADLLELWRRMNIEYSCNMFDKALASLVDRFDLHSL